MGWEVADIEAAVTARRARGVAFEEYDLPGLKTVNGIAEIAENYPSKGVGEKAPGSKTVRVISLASVKACAEVLPWRAPWTFLALRR
jgi:hypothetical protein